MTNLRKVGLPMVAILVLLALVLFNVGSAKASARSASWTVSVTYQNVGTAPASVLVEFYPEGSATPISFDPLAGGKINAGAGKSFWIGNVTNVTPGFKGNAVMSSDQPLVSTVVQFSQDPGFKMRLQYYGFQTSDAASQYLVPTVLLNKFGRTTVFSVQNTENETINYTIRFYDADAAGALKATATGTIPANSSKFIEMDDANDTKLPAGTTVFNGSAIVTATKSGGAEAKVVAAANEYYITSNLAASFEGLPVTRAANTVNVATGLCQRFGLDTFYAVSNSGLSGNASITVKYYNTNGTQKATDGPYSIGPGQKKSITTCSPSDGTNMVGFTGSAIVTSTGNPVVVVGKAQNSIAAGGPATQDVFTAFLGDPVGYSKLAIPFVRWANDTEYNSASNMGGKQRTYLAIQNLESSTITLQVKYNDKDGNTVATQNLTIPAKSKANSDPSAAAALGKSGMVTGSFGYYTDGSFGGGVVIQAAAANPTAKFIAISRTQNPGAGEDVNAVAAP